MTGQKILTLHPEGKQGVNIDLTKYNQIREAILGVLAEQGTLAFGELGDVIEQRLSGRFDGSVGWYYTTVKLDLEARGVLACDRRGSRQMISLASK